MFAAPSAPTSHVDYYLAIGQRNGASDIHLGPDAPPIWRLHGILQSISADAPKLTDAETAALAAGFLTEPQRAQLARQGDVDFAYANAFGRFRASVVRQRLGIEIGFCLIGTKEQNM